MSAPAAGTPRRLCPHCATLGYTHEDRCRFCGRRYRRRTLAAIAAMLAVTAAAVLAGIALMGAVAATAVEDRLQDEAGRVERELDREVRRLERDIRRELDRRLPAPAAPAP